MQKRGSGNRTIPVYYKKTFTVNNWNIKLNNAL